MTTEWPQTKRFTVSTADTLTELLDEIQNAPKPFMRQLYYVQIPVVQDEANFDYMVAKIEQAFEQRTFGRHVSAITGSDNMRRNLQAGFEQPGV